TGCSLSLDGVGDGSADERDAEEVLASFLDTLLDGRGNFLGLAVADADQTVAVAHDHQSGEAEATTALDDLRHTVDRDDTLDVVRLLGSVAATRVAVAAVATAAVVTAVGVLSGGAVAAVTPLTSRHQAFLPF